jgi:hypothetical protein
MLRAVAAGGELVFSNLRFHLSRKKLHDIPLREVLITTYVSTLASFTTFARLGMAVLWSVTIL